MRGIESKQSSMICLMSPATVVPQRHPLRAIKEFVDAALAQLGVAFDLTRLLKKASEGLMLPILPPTPLTS
jgi:hypothetical protein